MIFVFTFYPIQQRLREFIVKLIALSYQGQAFDKEEKYEEAIKMFDRVLALQPNENRLFSKAVVLYKMNRTSEAADAFRQVLKVNPENYKSCAALGTILCEQNEFVEAATLLEKVYESKEYLLLDKKSVLQNLGLAYIKAGKVEKGKKAFEELLKEDQFDMCRECIVHGLEI